MIFQDKTYSVLLVSNNDRFNDLVMPLLPANYFYPVCKVRSAGEARRKILDKAYDIVLINSPLPDEFGSELAADISSTNDSAVLEFVKNDVFNDIFAKVVESGVMMLAKPTSSQMVSQVLKIMCSVCEKLKRADDKQVTVEEKIKEIRLVNKAKWLLIDCNQMTEEQAHKYIEKQAMNLRISKSKVAENIINTYS